MRSLFPGGRGVAAILRDRLQNIPGLALRFCGDGRLLPLHHLAVDVEIHCHLIVVPHPRLPRSIKFVV